MSAKRCPVCDVDTSREHSDQERRHHFAVIRAAFDQWPADHRFMDEITGTEDLRAWLYCEVGYRAEIDLDLGDDPEAAAAFVVLLSQHMGKKVFVRMDGAQGVVWIAKSARKANCPHAMFCKLATAVDAVIERVLGVTSEQLLQEREPRRDRG